jgi:hypothetical protein
MVNWSRKGTPLPLVLADVYLDLLGHSPVLNMPVDVVKTRLMTQSSTGKYKGLLDCLLTVAKDEGLTALFRGIGLRVIIILLREGPRDFLNTIMMAPKGRDVLFAFINLLRNLEDGVA